jgi:hypothetical protein
VLCLKPTAVIVVVSGMANRPPVSSNHLSSHRFLQNMLGVYTPAPSKDGNMSKTSGRSGSLSSLRRAAVGEATPRCQSHHADENR